MQKVKVRVSIAELKAMKTQKGSKLLPFKNEIIYMREREDISFSKIKEWLEQQNVVTSTENIRQFFARYKSEFSTIDFHLQDETDLFDEQSEYASYDEIHDESPF